MPLVPELEDAIERLYVVFAPYRAGRVPGCPCCVSKEEQERLHSKRLRDLEGDDLGSFAMSALNTWGSLKDLKHFLPRILELSAKGELWTDLQTTFGKTVQEGPWSAEEQTALEAFARALFASRLGLGSRPRAVDVLEAAGLAGMDVEAMLDHGFMPGAAPPGAARASALAALVLDRAGAMASGSPGFIWWKGPGSDAVDRWLLSGRAYAVLMSAFTSAADHADAGEWAAACDVLEALGGRG